MNTNKGPRKTTFVSESGALQIIIQSHRPEAKRLRKWVCDLAIRYAKGGLGNINASEVVTRAEMVACMSGVAQTNLLLGKILTSLAPKVSTKRATYAAGPFDRTGQAEMTRRKMAEVTAFLTTETGNPKHGNSVAAGLTNRCISFADTFFPTTELYRRYKKRGKTVVFISEDIIKVVHRNGWHKGDPNPMNSDLFG